MQMHGSTHRHVQMPKPGLSTARWRSTRREHAHALVRAHAHTHADVHECAHAYSMGFVVRCGRANVLPSGTSAAHHRRVQGARQCAIRGPAIPGLYQTSMTGQPRARRAPRVDPPGQHPHVRTFHGPVHVPMMPNARPFGCLCTWRRNQSWTDIDAHVRGRR